MWKGMVINMNPEVQTDTENIKKVKQPWQWHKPTKIETVSELLTVVLFIVAIITYLLIGFLLGIWHPTWVIFLAPNTISSLVHAIGAKKANKFNYPFLVIIIYILLGSWFNLWHPLWVLFITIPLYYSFFKLMKELRN